jgi:hypothetical protein
MLTLQHRPTLLLEGSLEGLQNRIGSRLSHMAILMK